MRSKKMIERELKDIKRKIDNLNLKHVDETKLISENEKMNETSSNLFSLVKYMMAEQDKTRMILKGMKEDMERLTSELDGSYEDELLSTPSPQTSAQKEVLLSGIDAKIISLIQKSENSMACADEIKKNMNYKGRNAASARLNRLYKAGILERYQLGKTVFYKYDAGNATKILIVSPPHRE